jgi:hypothetical protein
MVREARVDKPATVMLYLKGDISFTYNTIAFTAIAKYAITATANLLAFEQGYPCELVIGSPTGRAC